MKTTFGAFAILGGLAVLASAQPAPAQQQGGQYEGVLRIQVFGDDPCPRSTEDEIVICERLDEQERYRIPKDLRETPGTRQENQSWAANVRYLETVNETGIQQCSPVGPAGQIGCLEELIDGNRAQRDAIDEENRYVPE